MDISELVFTNFAPVLYNIIFISLWILWFIYHREEENQRPKILLRKYLTDLKWLYPITGILIMIFLYFLLSYAVVII